MNSRGFTLVELIAVIIVLVAIFLVSFPSILNITRQDTEKQYDDMVETLCLAGKSYIYANMDKFPELSVANSKINVEIQDLISYGNIESNIINVKTEKTVNNDELIFTVLSDYSLDCEYNEK